MCHFRHIPIEMNFHYLTLDVVHPNLFKVFMKLLGLFLFISSDISIVVHLFKSSYLINFKSVIYSRRSSVLEWTNLMYNRPVTDMEIVWVAYLLTAPLCWGHHRVWQLYTYIFFHQKSFLTQPGLELAALRLRGCSTVHQATAALWLYLHGAGM